MDINLINEKYLELLEQITVIEEVLDVDHMEDMLLSIESEFSQPGFWDDHVDANIKTKQVSQLKNKLSMFRKCNEDIENIKLALELYELEANQDILVEVRSMINKLEVDLKVLYNQILLNGKYDECSAIIDIHAGAGGTEAQDWVEMLFRMYSRYCNNLDYKIKVLNYNQGDMAGIKSITIEVLGELAYGLLKSEHGVHRLIRISPFDVSGKRHTSFASVDVVPILDKIEDIEIDKNELKIDTYRASGAGGQSVNTTDSAVRITHLPTGIVVSCQNERSQIQNREYAMKMLMSKLVTLEEEKRRAEIDLNAGEKSEIGWGSQIRTYTFQPYALVKDHRTNYEVGNVKSVMDGDLTEFVIRYLEYITKNKR